MNKIKDKRGYSLAEALIALAVILIVSATSLSISISSINTKADAVNRSRAMGFADNVWECFKAADDEASLLSLVEFAEGVVLDGENGEYRYISENNDFVANIRLSNEDGRDKIYIKVTDTSNNEIISFDYTKED